MAINTKNGLMLQAFSWYLPADGQHWRRLAKMAPRFAEEGFTSVWMPPAYKGQAGAEDVGYGVYDLWDLGEFDQKGSVRTKYGTRHEYLAAIRTIQEQGVNVLADVVLNHRMGADGTQLVLAQECDGQDRTKPVGEPREIRAYTRFEFPGRAGRLDHYQWGITDFTGVDYDELEGTTGVYRFVGKEWSGEVSHELGNYDYLMGADVDLDDPRVRAQLATWGAWYLGLTGVDGVRLAVFFSKAHRKPQGCVVVRPAKRVEQAGGVPGTAAKALEQHADVPAAHHAQVGRARRGQLKLLQARTRSTQHPRADFRAAVLHRAAAHGAAGFAARKHSHRGARAARHRPAGFHNQRQHAVFAAQNAPRQFKKCLLHASSK